MSYDIDAFVGKRSDLAAWKEQFGSAGVFTLPQGLALAPLTYGFLGELRETLGLRAIAALERTSRGRDKFASQAALDSLRRLQRPE